jgi:hypothetical protein
MNASLRLLVLVLVLTARASLAAPLEVRVTLLDENRLPRLSPEQVRKVLDVAQRMLARGADADVVFRIENRMTVREFLDGERRRIAPYVRQKDSFNDIFRIEQLPLDALALAGCRRYGTVEQLRNLFERAEREHIDTHADAARLLVRKYKQRVGDIKRVKNAAGDVLITPENWQDFSLAHWEVYFASMAWSEGRRLYLANTLLVDDLRAFAPHSMITGLANGVAYPGVNAAIIAYYPIVSGDAALRTHRLGDLAEDERLAVVAYVVAHEIGAHLIKHERDDYRSGSGLARPIAALADKPDVMGYEQWPKHQVDPLPLDVEGIKWWMCDLRIEVCIARNDPIGALEVLELVSQLNVEERDKAVLERKVRTAWGEE